MSHRPEFDSGGLAVGEVFGVRWWDLGSDGKLRGAHSPVPWVPGENIASCQRYCYDLSAAHAVPDSFCGCGFWAYWKQPFAPEVGGQLKVLGIIKGYGPTLVGEKGFRCAKAEIVALHTAFKVLRPDPDWKPPATRALWEPPKGMFHRGPRGMDTYHALTGYHRPPAEPPMIEDNEALMAVQVLLEQAYQAPVYANPQAMFTRHKLTTDYSSPDPGHITVTGVSGMVAPGAPLSFRGVSNVTVQGNANGISIVSGQGGGGGGVSYRNGTSSGGGGGGISHSRTGIASSPEVNDAVWYGDPRYSWSMVNGGGHNFMHFYGGEDAP